MSTKGKPCNQSQKTFKANLSWQSFIIHFIMLNSLFFIKLIVSVCVVVMLSVIAERVSSRVAGILSGYPTGAAINLFFFGLEISPEFASDSAVYTMIGLIATQSFIYFYYKSSSTFKKLNIIKSSIVSITGYLIVIWALHFIKLNRFAALFIPVTSIFIFIYLFKEIPDIEIKNRIRLSHNVLFARALFAASIILLITGIARSVGSTFAGLFSAFPSTLFPLILIVHSTYCVEHVHTLIKNVPIGIGSLIAYSLTVSICYPLFGVYLGTVLSFIAATIYLIIYESLRSKIKRLVCRQGLII